MLSPSVLPIWEIWLESTRRIKNDPTFDLTEKWKDEFNSQCIEIGLTDFPINYLKKTIWHGLDQDSNSNRRISLHKWFMFCIRDFDQSKYVKSKSRRFKNWDTKDLDEDDLYLNETYNYIHKIVFEEEVLPETKRSIKEVIKERIDKDI
jgi:hypothetical protein